MPLPTTPPSPMRLKPLAWSILLALSSPAALAEGETPAAKTSTPNMGAIEIELPAGFEDALKKSGTSQKGLQVLEASEVKADWEEKDEKGNNDVYRKDVSNVYVGKDDIERYKGASVGDLFKGLNGVYAGDSRNSGSLDPNIRGIQGEGRIPVTIDGTEQATSVWMGSAGVSNRNYVDPNMIGSISVEKGPSMTAGVRSGIGGSVEIKTLDAEDVVRPGERYGLEIKTETGTNSVKPNEEGMDKYGKDYRDIDGAYVSGNAVVFSRGGGAAFTPHEASRYNDFDFQDNAMRIAAATRQDNFDLFAAYSYRNRGNYYSGKGGSQRYTTDASMSDTIEGNRRVSGDTSRAYIGNLYPAGNEVAGTSSEMRTTLLKSTFYLPHEQSLKLSYMHSDMTLGESIPYVINESVKLQAMGVLPSRNVGFQFPYSEVKQDTFALTYKWAPEDSRWVDLQAGFWATQNHSDRYQNGDEVYTVRDTYQRDQGWDRYVECSNNPSSSGCAGVSSTAPEKLANTDGRFDIISRALQTTRHDRTGVNLSNRIKLADAWSLTLSGDFSKEKLAQKDYASQDTGTVVTFANRYMGPRSGRREQYNFSFNNEWSATPWLVLSAGARYSDYNAFDTGLDEHRKNQDLGWDASSAVVGKQYAYFRLLSDSENQALVDSIRAEVESWGLDPVETEESIAYELAHGVIDGHRYVEESVVIPTKGFILDSGQNPFLNGTLNLGEQVANAQGTGTSAARYLAGTGGAYVYGPEPTEAQRWAKPKKQRDSAWAPMASATVLFTERARAYVRYSEFVRFPSVYEGSQAISGSAKAATTNSMRPEHAYNWEVGFAHDLRGVLPDWRHADWRINYFRNEIHDYVDRDYAYNIVQYEKKLLSGIELQTRFDHGRYFSNFAATYRLDQKLCDRDATADHDPYYGKAIDECVTGGFPSTFSRTSLQPQYSINLDGGLRLFDEKLELGARMVYHSKSKNKEEAKWIAQGLNFVAGTNEPFQWQPIWVFDAYASLKINQHLDVDVGINNITNRYYIDPLARVAMPAPGRTMKVGLAARF